MSDKKFAQKRIFQRFYRVEGDRSGTSGDSGLGLALAPAIAGAHHGNLTGQSELEKESKFIIQLLLASRLKMRSKDLPSRN